MSNKINFVVELNGKVVERGSKFLPNAKFRMFEAEMHAKYAKKSTDRVEVLYR